MDLDIKLARVVLALLALERPFNDRTCTSCISSCSLTATRRCNDRTHTIRDTDRFAQEEHRLLPVRGHGRGARAEARDLRATLALQGISRAHPARLVRPSAQWPYFR